MQIVLRRPTAAVLPMSMRVPSIITRRAHCLDRWALEIKGVVARGHGGVNHAGSRSRDTRRKTLQQYSSCLRPFCRSLDLALEKSVGVTRALAHDGPSSESETFAPEAPRVLERSGDDIAVHWPASSRLVALEAERESVSSNLLVRIGEFCDEGNLSKYRMHEIQNWGEENQMQTSQLLSLRSQLLVDRTMFVHQKVERKARQMQRQYQNGKSVLEISQSTNLPPLSIFRAVMKLEHPDWYDLAGERVRPWKHLTVAMRAPDRYMTPREQAELKVCHDMDISSFKASDMAQESGRHFEEHLAQTLSHLEVPFDTEEEIRARPGHRRGDPTPDFVFQGCNLKINGEEVQWIDAKCLYGAATSKTIMKKLQKQAGWYNEAFGQGAVVFARGHCSALSINGAMLLDMEPDFDGWQQSSSA